MGRSSGSSGSLELGAGLAPGEARPAGTQHERTAKAAQAAASSSSAALSAQVCRRQVRPARGGGRAASGSRTASEPEGMAGDEWLREPPGSALYTQCGSLAFRGGAGGDPGVLPRPRRQNFS